MKINIEPKTESEKILIEYLEEHASDELKEKINNGVSVEKDGQQLISKKTLAGCLKYCCDEAKKMAEQGATSACIKDEVVFGWAMHFFQEDSIEGTLYNQDGTEYKAPKKQQAKKTTTPKATPKTTPKKTEPQIAQSSLFDLMDEPTVTDINPTLDEILEYNIDENHDNDEDEDEDVVDEIVEEVIEKQEPVEVKQTAHPYYQQYLEIQKQYPTAVVFMRLGDFYETFGGNAIQIAGELDLTLTSKDVGIGERVALIGIPYHAADTYFLKVHANHDMVVWEKDNDLVFLPVKTKTVEHEKHWVDDNTYVDENGEIHTVERVVPDWITSIFGKKVITR